MLNSLKMAKLVGVRKKNVDIKEVKVNVTLPVSIPLSKVVPNIVPVVQEHSNNNEQNMNDNTPNEDTNSQVSEINESQEVPLRRSQRERKSSIPNIYETYLLESDIGINKDPVSFLEAMNSVESEKWIDAMKEELKSMQENKVWEIVELPKDAKRVGCKWVFKTKRDSNGNIERYKARLVVDYKETFSPVSKKDSLCIIMALVAHYDLELHQMDVKTAFLNGSLEEEVYMDQPEGFPIEGKGHMVCKLKKSIYGLKQASRQWYIKFNDTITSFGFEENLVDRCIYRKISGSKFMFLVLYVDDILLATNSLSMLHETKNISLRILK